jgi:diguanylate cyclase (GGDEF)-like protein/PAS domain S-box-containing protein
MALLSDRLRAVRRTYGLSAAVLAGGLLLSAWTGVARYHQAHDKHVSALRDAAQDYEFLLRHRLDLYAGVSRDVAAFFSASDKVEPHEFASFIEVSRVFARLEGIRAFGYMPRVPAGDAGTFEREARRLFPGYRIADRRPGAPEYYPFLYGCHATDPNRMAMLRGLDYGAMPERRAAMDEAARVRGPAATARITAARDPRERQIVLVFAPVHATHAGGVLTGFTFAALYLEPLFLGFDNGRMARQFELKVYDGSTAPGNVVFDTGGTRQGPDPAAPALPAYRAQVPFAQRTWLIEFHARDDGVAAAARAGAMTAATGAALSLLAACTVVAWPRYRSGRRAMREFSKRFASFFEHHPFAVYAVDPERRFLHVNRQMARELGVPREELIGGRIDDFVGTEDRAEAARRFGEALSGQAATYTMRVTERTGRGSDLSIVLIPMSAGDRVTHVLGFAENITERKEAERALYASRQMLQLILDNIPQSVFWKNRDSVYEGGNRALLADAGLASDRELIGRTDHELRWRDNADEYRRIDREVMESGVPRMRMQARDRRADGTDCWVETSKIPLKDDAGNVVGVLAVTEDITPRKYMEQELFRRAHHDMLTGLPNRAYFMSHLEGAVARAERQGALALMYFDIDHFKRINDTWGHDAGDAVIRAFADRVRAAVRESDFVARLGGDEFVLVAEGLHPGEAAVRIAAQIVAALEEPLVLDAAVLRVTTSIGVACWQPGMPAEALIRAADGAMYDAKRAGRGCYRLAA